MILKIKFMSSPHGLLYLFMLLIIFKVGNTEQFNRRAQCLHKERIALLKFKAELIDDYGRLSTWGNNIDDDDCCRWEGVICDNTTNHVIALDLQGDELLGPLRGKKSSALWSSSLIELNDLHYLDLSHNDFSGNHISESIYSLSKLQHLDLSSSSFGGRIPHRLGNLSMLRHLNLSYSNFGGIIPHHLGNLSMLRHLDLNWNNDLKVNDNLDWLTGLHSLEYLDLTYVNLEMASSTWLRTISNLKTLKALYLHHCGLSETTALSLGSTIINDSSTTTSSSLAILDLSWNNLNSTPTLIRFLNLSISISYIDFSSNNFDGRILDSLGHLLSLSHLDLSNNQLQGDFPQSFKNLINLRNLDFGVNELNGQFIQMMTLLENSTKLEYIDFTRNALVGPFPNMSRFSFLKELRLQDNKFNGPLLEGNLNLPHLEVLDVSVNRFCGRVPDLTSYSSSLRVLSLNDNMFNGALTESISYLSKLEDLSLSSNQLEGIFSEAHLFNLSRLQNLDLSFNSNLTVKISSSWNPPFQLYSLWSNDCNLGPDFPEWLQRQKKLARLNIANTKIQDIVPDWFWDNFHVFELVDISYNRIHGVVPDLSSMFNLTTIYLLSNQFNGSLPLMPPDVLTVDLSNNSFSGTIVHFCNKRYSWGHLDLSNNLLFGEIPKDFFSNLPFLSYLNLADNNFSGQIPNSLRPYCIISSLHLQNNNFSGQIPTSLSNCVGLVVVELGKNKLTGKIPSWLGKMPNLAVLSMKSNNFYGSLPLSICHLAEIKVLDISINNFSGTIPKCLNNFSSMSIKPDATKLDNFLISSVFQSRESAQLMWKGKDAKYANSLGLLRFLDFSSNNLGGEIPPEITSLVGLTGLNLSGNNLVGPIPHDIGRLESLDFFDLSRNNLSGGIPANLSQMNQLGVLNLSFNNLSGRIPWRSHLQTFSDSSFMGNPGLCGDPLQSKPCPEDLLPKKPMVKDNDDDEDENSDSSSIVGQEFYICMALGFVISFCVVLGTIFHNRSCNIIFSKMLKSAGDWLYVKILVHKNRLKRHFENQSGRAS